MRLCLHTKLAPAALPCLLALCTVGIGLSAAQAQPPAPAPPSETQPARADADTQRCATQADPALRLDCYDKLFGRTPEVTLAADAAASAAKQERREERHAARSADADAPAIGPGDYDAVLAFNLLHLVSDLDGALGSVVQALRPGGRLISKTACISEMNPLIPWLAIPLMRAVGKAPHVLCFDAETLKAAMVRQGLEIDAVERHGTNGKDIRVFIVARKPG